MANGEADASMQIRLQQTDGKLLRAIDDALARIRNEEFGICAECSPLAKHAWKRCPGAGGVGTARNGRTLEAELLAFLENQYCFPILPLMEMSMGHSCAFSVTEKLIQ
jgi:hypothetical protein